MWKVGGLWGVGHSVSVCPAEGVGACNLACKSTAHPHHWPLRDWLAKERGCRHTSLVAGVQRASESGSRAEMHTGNNGSQHISRVHDHFRVSIDMFLLASTEWRSLGDLA